MNLDVADPNKIRSSRPYEVWVYEGVCWRVVVSFGVWKAAGGWVVGLSLGDSDGVDSGCQRSAPACP